MGGDWLPCKVQLIDYSSNSRAKKMQVPTERKSCMEITGGRKSEDVQYQMPGLQMRIFSKQSEQGLEGGGEIHFVSSCASGRITRILIADICGSESIFKQFSCQIRDGLLKSINSIWQTSNPAPRNTYT